MPGSKAAGLVRNKVAENNSTRDKKFADPAWLMIPSATLIDLGIASFIVAFSSGMTYGIIHWFRRSRRASARNA